jgi:hypothetical protein
MSMKSFAVTAMIVAVLTGARCNSSSSPTSPTPTPPPQAAPTPTPTPTPTPPPSNATGRLEITINPNPVPFSGVPITDAAGCAGSANTWFYDQVLRETGGAQVTITNRVDVFDGRTANDRSGLDMVVPANGTLTVPSRWCSSTNAEHSTQTTFAGRDARSNNVQITSPVIRLLPR